MGVLATTIPSVATAAPAASATTITATPSAAVATTGSRVLVRGAVSGGQRDVRLEQLVGRTWRTIDTATSSGNGAYSLVVPTDTPDVRVYRVAAAASSGDQAAASRQFTVAVGDGDARAVSYLTTPAVRWDPCTTVGYRVNLAGAPDGALDDIRRAVTETSKATGVRYRYLGTTTVVPGATTTDLPEAYPSDTRLVIAYTTPSRSKFLGKGTDMLGVGGVFYDLTPVKVGRASWFRALQGYVVLDSRRDLPGGFGSGSETGVLGTWGQVLMHELGHTVGLDHPAVADKAQIMYQETTHKDARWGAGDLVGLRRLGSASGCFPKTKNRTDLSLGDRAVPPSWGMPSGADARRLPPKVGKVQPHGR